MQNLEVEEKFSDYVFLSEISCNLKIFSVTDICLVFFIYKSEALDIVIISATLFVKQGKILLKLRK